MGATPATTGASLQVVEVFGRGAVTEDAQVVDKLHSHIPADGEVGGVADVVATHRAAEVLVLVKDVVHADAQLAPAVAEYLFADEGVAEQILFVVVIGDTLVLAVCGVGCEGETAPRNPLQVCSGPLVEVPVLLCAEFGGVVVDVVADVVGQREVQVFGDVAAELRTAPIV